MSITPIGEGEDSENGESSRDPGSGVRARLRSWFESVGRGIRKLRQQFQINSSGEPKAERTPDHKKGEIRVGGQRRLEGPRSTARGDESAETPTVHGQLPSGTSIDAEQNGDTFCLYDPELPDAYITSDTWEDIER